MAQIDMHDTTLTIKDGAGNEIIFTNCLPTKIPKTARQQAKATERMSRVGGKCRSARLRKKKRTARMRGCPMLVSPYRGNITWEETNEVGH